MRKTLAAAAVMAAIGTVTGAGVSEAVGTPAPPPIAVGDLCVADQGGYYGGRTGGIPTYYVKLVGSRDHAIKEKIPVHGRPMTCRLTAGDKKAYVVLQSGGDTSKTVAVIDTVTGRVTGTIDAGRHPGSLTFSPDGEQAYVPVVSKDGSGSVSVIDTATDRVTKSFPVGTAAIELAASPDGRKLYATSMGHDGHGAVTVIDTATGKVIDTIKLTKPIWGVGIDPDGKKLYVTGNYGNPTVTVIDTATDKVTRTIEVGKGPGSITFSEDGKKAYVANCDGTVSVIDTASGKVIATMQVDTASYFEVLSPDGTKLYVSNARGKSVAVIDTARDKVTDTITGFDYPAGLDVFRVTP